MPGKDPTEILEEILPSDIGLPLTDEAVDAYLLQPQACTQEAIDRMQKKYTIKAFLRLHPHPVLHIEEKKITGRWIEAKIKDAMLTVDDFASATGIRKPQLKKLISGKLLPWHFNLTGFAEIVDTINVHISAITELAERSLAVSKEYERSERTKRSIRESRPEDKDPDIRRALDATFAQQLRKVQLTKEVEDWLLKLRRELERRHATRLF
jgi:transcriptional regulator with XRE-family HTH domain